MINSNVKECNNMGKEKTTSTSESSSKNTVTASPEEQELNKLTLDQRKSLMPGETSLAQQTMDVLSGILSGGKGLPEAFSSIFTGISPEITNELAQQAIGDLAPQFQSSGMLDSGAAMSIAGRTAGDIRRGVAESNLARQFNMLNLGLGGSGSQQGIGAAQTQGLGGQLAGLRSTYGTQSSNQTTLAMNPFLKSFQQAAGNYLGSGSFLPGGSSGAPSGGYSAGKMANMPLGYTVPNTGLGYTPINVMG